MRDERARMEWELGTWRDGSILRLQFSLLSTLFGLVW